MQIFPTVLSYNHKEKRKMIGFTLEVTQYNELKHLSEVCGMSKLMGFIVEQFLNGGIEVDCRTFIEKIEGLLNKNESFKRDRRNKKQRYHDKKQLSLFDLRIAK